MRILVVTDAWFPQVNGVVRTLDTLKARLEERGHDLIYVTPQSFRTIPCPTYSEIRLAVLPGRTMARAIETFQPCVIHIATEGPLGLSARRYCLKRGVPFTTAFHTKFPEYLHARFRVPVSWGYKGMRWFHGPSKTIMVATQGIEDELLRWGFSHIRRWTRGVDTELFRPRPKGSLDGVITGPRPWFVYVGRVAVEKNIGAFLDLDLPGTKIVVGGGPQLESLRARHPKVHFAGERLGEELATYFSVGDAFVFPSRTDTFGLVLLEALASGLPVAAYPVPGPLDVIGDAPVGALDEDLKAAALRALTIDPAACRAFAQARSWETSVDQFLANVHPFPPADFFPSDTAPLETAMERGAP
ncbi:alpha-mannosyltransferase [Rhodospirillum rubrum]|uniref:glycosyltransferase family 4 protein n=1 Tax=Rhodospirillum rubrum TaxID=1085 RepID=UPI00190792C2|nr:glycosyltransferase family 1 protein [Rhodospirillum rubrum]MBK1664267.1 alpha-mannosyltransferase [Rhodospirillum rubrum]MBK1675315.1 alpha-mannosyltransferase [Rhodospirillum rubrum]